MIKTRMLPAHSRLPALMRLGLVVFALGVSLDVLHHAAPAAWSGALDLYLGHEGVAAHMVTFGGMVLTMLGVLAGRYGHAR